MKKATSNTPTITKTVNRRYGKSVVSLTMKALQYKRILAKIRKGVHGLTKEQAEQCAHVSCQIAVDLVAEISAFMTEKEIQRMIKPVGARELRRLKKVLTPMERMGQVLGIPPVELTPDTDPFYRDMKPARKQRKNIVPANDLKN